MQYLVRHGVASHDDIDHAGAFAGESDLVRRQGIQNQIMVAWALHEVGAAMVKAVDGNFDPASGAPHNWDESGPSTTAPTRTAGRSPPPTGAAATSAPAAAPADLIPSLLHGRAAP